MYILFYLYFELYREITRKNGTTLVEENYVTSSLKKSPFVPRLSSHEVIFVASHYIMK